MILPLIRVYRNTTKLQLCLTSFAFSPTIYWLKLHRIEHSARGGRHSGPCLGDSGGGFFVKSGKQWILQGIISSAFLNGDGCDTDTFSVYTNINYFTLWIKNTIEGSGSSSHGIRLTNSYGVENYDGSDR